MLGVILWIGILFRGVSRNIFLLLYVIEIGIRGYLVCMNILWIEVIILVVDIKKWKNDIMKINCIILLLVL